MLTLEIDVLLALRTIGRSDVPYRIAALASFTSSPIAHGVGAVALVSPMVRYRIYSYSGLGAVDVANICFLTGLTFWLGNLTALGLSLFHEPGAIGLMDYLPPQVNRLLAAALLLAVVAFLVWSWLAPRRLGTRRWMVRLPSGPMVLLQIAIGILDLGAAALAIYVLIPALPLQDSSSLARGDGTGSHCAMPQPHRGRRDASLRRDPGRPTFCYLSGRGVIT
jgi:uncharacterized membrane protein YbhN (UPF0104 family)